MHQIKQYFQKLLKVDNKVKCTLWLLFLLFESCQCEILLKTPKSAAVNWFYSSSICVFDPQVLLLLQLLPLDRSGVQLLVRSFNSAKEKNPLSTLKIKESLHWMAACRPQFVRQTIFALEMTPSSSFTATERLVTVSAILKLNDKFDIRLLCYFETRLLASKLIYL